jgi:hypothetical protein
MVKEKSLMCPISTFQFVLQVFGVFGIAVFLGLTGCYGVEIADRVLSRIKKGEANEPE